MRNKPTQLEINTISQLIFDKDSENIKRQKDSLFKVVLEKMNIYMQKKKIWNLILHPTHNQLKMGYILKIGTLKLLRGNTSWHWPWRWFMWYSTWKEQATKSKNKQVELQASLRDIVGQKTAIKWILQKVSHTNFWYLGAYKNYVYTINSQVA